MVLTEKKMISKLSQPNIESFNWFPLIINPKYLLLGFYKLSTYIIILISFINCSSLDFFVATNYMVALVHQDLWNLHIPLRNLSQFESQLVRCLFPTISTFNHSPSNFDVPVVYIFGIAYSRWFVLWCMYASVYTDNVYLHMSR